MAHLFRHVAGMCQCAFVALSIALCVSAKEKDIDKAIRRESAGMTHPTGMKPDGFS